METYIASRISNGNKLFPCKIAIDTMGVTVVIPGFFKGEEKTIPFQRIASVQVQTPLVGYSSISIESTGEGLIYAHGFTKREVREMKRIILEKLNK
jgi:hypothetical protein